MKVRQMLHYVKKGDEIVSRPLYYVLENCMNSIKSLAKYSYKDLNTASGDEKKQPGPREEYKDFCDLDRYYFMSNPQFSSAISGWTPEERKVY